MSDVSVKDDYAFCQQLLVENISNLEKTEVYATGAVAATMVFSLAASDPNVALWSAIVAMLVSGVGLIRWRGLDSVIGTLNDYLVATGPVNGWSAYYRGNRKAFLKQSRWLIWGLLNLVSFTLALFMAIHGPLASGSSAQNRGDARAAAEASGTR